MELLQRCRDHAHKFYADLLMAAEKTVADALFSHAEQCTSNEDQRRFFEAMQELKSRGGALHATFRQQLGTDFQTFVSGSDREQSLDEKIDMAKLSLVHRDELEDELAVSVIISKANSRNSETLWKLNRRLAVLRGGRAVNDETNPFGPAVVCHALQLAMAQLNLDSKAKILIYKQLGKVFIISFGKELEALNEILVEQGILPNLRFTISREAGAPAPEIPIDDTASAEIPAEGFTTAVAPALMESSTAIANQQQLYRTIRQLQAKTGPRTHTAGGVSLGGIATDGSGGADTFSPMDYAVALSAIQQSRDFLSAAALARPLSIAAVEEKLFGHLTKNANPKAHHKMARDDADTVDLVGMIFRYMLDDPHLHDSVKSLLSHLHTPYLKLALLDKTFLDNYQHSARLLLNTLADVGARWVKEDDDRAVLPKIKTTVENVLKGFVDDVTLFDRLLEDFSRFRENLEKRAKMVEKRNTEAQQGLERLELARQQAIDELEKRLLKARIPEVISDLLRQPWTDFLSFNLLRHGEESLTWQSALKVLDGVIFSLRPDQTIDSKDDLHRRQLSLEQMVSEGLSTIGYDRQASKGLLNSLHEAQELVYRGIVDADTGTPGQTDTNPIEPVPETASTPIPTGKPVSTKRRPPLKPQQPPLTAEETGMLEKLREIAFGTWFEFDRENTTQQLKLAWFSRVTSHYMFVDQTGVKQAVETQYNLARGMCAGAIRIAKPTKKSFMERALDAVLEKLKLT